MLSGNGRHRRPRQAPALLVAAGVTGSAIAIPLLGATGASAASGSTWDHVAECESGGSWSADTGNDLYGGLQLSQDDWNHYGGLDYAPSPDKASRSQQIAVAEKILAAEGVAAWPTCGPLSGLSKDSGSADVDTGLGSGSGESGKSGSGLDLGLDNSSGNSDSSASSGSSGSSESSGKSSGKSGSTSDEASGKASASPSKKGEDSSRASGDSRSGGKSTTSPETSDKSGDSSAGRSSGSASEHYRQSPGSSALVDTGAVDGTKGANTLIADGTGRHRGSSAEDGSTYTVRHGDTLGSIADSLDVDGGWQALYQANEDAIGSDPSVIRPGQSLVVE
ncbi:MULTISPECIES: LysM peptidoglycan-binding domain-containing protein [Streptomyces]|jgi:LysM repeat protein|uniref:LysM peptidoglycan-binding domain-containing protein n=2 Tax=Streptomyces griseoaurantiacus TaxID=68213 RepID=A0A7W2DZZ9_9ACTN|nr:MULTISPECIES: transglycosylase family protein [Streptomyces]MBA5226171.1 LysM peptidoglycan-binding domain-containing protein [Streptomyces griseoaurantiacus]NJP71880.1 LysM peptidoglycan-binding domain-containing protein [Streptomyces sp. C1-2]SDG49007.1 LysM domain-containing protein [Streptomyces jietaisiensis]